MSPWRRSDDGEQRPSARHSDSLMFSIAASASADFVPTVDATISAEIV
jgi:hypothetical protein